MISTASLVFFGAAFRALLAACAVWIGMRLLKVRNVRAQKAAWSVLLLAALTMPLLMLGRWLPAWAEVRVPILPRLVSASAAPTIAQTAAREFPAPVVAQPTRTRTAVPMAFSPQNTTSKKQSAPIVADGDSAPIMAQYDYVVPRMTAGMSQSLSRQTSPETVTLPTPPAVAPHEPSQTKTTHMPISWRAIAWLIYFTVGAAFLLRWLVGFVCSIKLWFEATPVDAAKECGLPGTGATRMSCRISSPVNIGSGIVLPADYTEWEVEKLRAVLAHERSHVRQGDFYLQLIAGLYTAFNWFSPLGWWLKHNLSELSEAISDRAALKESISASAYAQLLLEFAALPRSTVTGVAMAHSSNLSHRIERLLDDSHFKQAFDGTQRAFIAAVIVPAILVAATAMVRVEAAPLALSVVTPQAAAQAPNPAQEPAASPYAGQSNPSDQATPPPQATPAPAPSADDAGAPPPLPPMPEGAPQKLAPAASEAPQHPAVAPAPPIPPVPPIHVEVHVPPIPPEAFNWPGEWGGFSGAPFAIVGDPGSEPRLFGEWNSDRRDSTRDAEIDKVRKIARGHFILFRRDDKWYFIDDPATVSQAEALDNAIKAQREKMHDLSKQMREMGEKQREEGRKAMEEARKANKAAREIPTPDLSKQMAQLNAAVASLQAHKAETISREQLAEIQRDVNELQRQLMGAQLKIDVDLNLNGVMSQFNEKQAKFGDEMGQLGAQMGKLARDNHQRMQEILEDSLKNGKARPVN